MTFLLDVNVLIALIDPAHVHHDPAHAWFSSEGQRDWATCPLTENGVLRIVGSPRYPGGPGTPSAVAPLMARLRALSGHAFWSDEVSLLDENIIDLERLLSVEQVSDTYLLALAKARGGKLATFDKRLVTDAVRDGARHLQVIT
jgi:toxin-antitoxin system PIN domain toxin